MDDVINKRPSIVRKIVQWFLVAFFVMIAVVLSDDIGKLELPGAPKIMFCAVAFLTALLIILNSPAVFFRLSEGIKMAANAGFLLIIPMASTYASDMAKAYEKTPQGAREAAERREDAARLEAERKIEAAQQAKAEAERASAEKLLADIAEAKEKAEEMQEQLEACFSGSDHQLSNLSETVRDNLHNPDAFQHVETVLIVPDQERHNVVMTFRAENGFGATRTAQVRASLVPESCEVDNISEPEVS